MVRKHIPREYSSHRKDKFRPMDEFYKVEIISYEHDLTKMYYSTLKNITGKNTKIKSWKGWSAYIIDDSKKDATVTCNYFVKQQGEYRIDVFYENYSTKNGNGKFMGKSVKFEGSVNHLKHKPFYKQFNEGNQTITIKLPKDMYFYGLIVRKTKEYVGDSLSSAGTNLLLEKVNTTFSSQIAPSEASFEIAYDNDFECLSTSTGLYMDYNDEINIYIKGKDAINDTRVFGGYLSAIQADENKTKLTVSCADTMIEGQNKYILSHMELLGGSKLPAEREYTSDMDINFNKYGEALKYLCNSLGLTLHNNIADNNLVTGETAKKGFNIEFGKKKTIKKVTCKNSTAEFSKNFVTIRNNPSATKKQEIILYDGKKQGRQTPVEITEYPNFGIVYGLGKTKTEHEETSTQTVDKGDGNAGSQSFSKCGVSADGKYIMAIGLPSAGGDISKAGGYKWKKRMFKNECPYCKSIGRPTNKLVFDIFYGDSVHGAGRSECNNNQYESGGGIEGHIFCRSCDSDYSIITGKRHGGTGGNIKPVTPLQDSSKAEAKKLKAGKYTATPTGETLTADDIFDAIWKLAKSKKLHYKLYGTTYQTASDLEKHGVGDCWAFSDWIFKQLKGYKVNCRIVQYPTSESGVHRTVQYMNNKRQWTDYPYRSHGWSNMLYNTSGSKHPHSIIKKYTAGGTISQAKSSSGSSTETTKVKVTEGYDRDKPIQGYFAVTYSTSKSFKAKTTTVNVGFTQKAGTTNSLSGFSPVWINDTVKNLNVDLLDFIKDSVSEEATKGEKKYYLHSIKFVAPVNKVIDTDATNRLGKVQHKIEDWYTNDKSTKDNSSCKMDIYSLNFNNATLINPTDLESCGKSVNSLFEEILKASKYTANRTYGKHRCDDMINFSVDNKTDAAFIAMEGDENNILQIGGISYTPRTTLFNNSTVVFKTNSQRYKYVQTHDVESILKYGEQTNLITSSDVLGSKEAYYNALNNPNYNPVEQFNFTLTLPYFVDVHVGDLVQVIANSRKLNTIKTVTSVKYECDHKQIPKIQTELGLGELPVDLQIAKELRELRALAKKETTYFSSSAEPVEDDIYVWDN